RGRNHARAATKSKPPAVAAWILLLAQSPPRSHLSHLCPHALRQSKKSRRAMIQGGIVWTRGMARCLPRRTERRRPSSGPRPKRAAKYATKTRRKNDGRRTGRSYERAGFARPNLSRDRHAGSCAWQGRDESRELESRGQNDRAAPRRYRRAA